MAKDKKPANPRNHLAVAVGNPTGIFRQKAAKSGAERADQRDQFSRNAKYKVQPRKIDLEEEAFQHGDAVNVKMVDDKGKPVTKKGMVKIPKAPLGMVGLTVDGQYALVPEDKVTLIAESLARMIELSK